jgi:hypothetical protein
MNEMCPIKHSLESRIPWILAISFVICQMTVDYLRFDFWPLTAYPMYAHPKLRSEVSTFQILANTSDHRQLVIPVPGGAATMFVYNEFINAGKFKELQDRMVQDFYNYSRTTKDLKDQSIVSLSLAKVGIAQDKVTQDISFKSDVLHGFTFRPMY